MVENNYNRIKPVENMANIRSLNRIDHQKEKRENQNKRRQNAHEQSQLTEENDINNSFEQIDDDGIDYQA